jgi:hypothetical protein
MLKSAAVDLLSLAEQAVGDGCPSDNIVAIANATVLAVTRGDGASALVHLGHVCDSSAGAVGEVKCAVACHLLQIVQTGRCFGLGVDPAAVACSQCVRMLVMPPLLCCACTQMTTINQLSPKHMTDLRVCVDAAAQQLARSTQAAWQSCILPWLHSAPIFASPTCCAMLK